MRSWQRLVPAAAALVPPALVAAVMVRDAVDVPFMDQWVFGGTIANAARGLFDPWSLWAPNNEHRVVLPRLLMLGLAHLTGWDVRWEQATSFVVALGTLAVLTALLVRTVGPRAPALVPWLVPLVALQMFSMAQWQNWTWGWQMAIFLNAFAAVLTAYAVAHWDEGCAMLPWILLAALAAVLSFASGLALLPLVPLALLALGGRKAVAPAAVSALAGAAIIVTYFTDFKPVGNPPRHVLPHEAPLAFLRYVCAYLGAGFAAGDGRMATAWGAAGLAALVAAVVRLWRCSGAHWTAMVPWAMLALYGVLAGVLTAVGRLATSSDTALLSRYITMSALFWTGLIVVTGLALAAPARTPSGSSTRRAAIGLAFVAFAVGALGYARTWALGEASSQARAAVMRRGLACLPEMETAPDACLRLLCWDAKVLRFFGAPVKALHLGPFRPRA